MRAKIVNRFGRAALLMMLLAMALGADAQPGGEQKPRPIELLGVLAPVETVNFHVALAGFIDKCDIDIGDIVKKGDLLAKLAAPDLEKDLAKKKLLVRKAELGVKQAKQAAIIAALIADARRVDMDAAKAALKTSAAEAEKRRDAYERYAGSRRKKVFDKEVADELATKMLAAAQAQDAAEAKLKPAEAAYKQAAAKRDLADIAVEIAKADLDLAKEDVDAARDKLALTEIRAPFDGVITQRNVFAGHYVRPPSAANAEPLFVLVRFDRVRVVFDVPGRLVEKITKGTPAIVRDPLDREHKGAVTRTAFVIDPEASGRRTEIDLPNPDRKLYPGWTVKVIFTVK